MHPSSLRILALLLASSLPATRPAGAADLLSSPVDHPPVLDGRLDPGEWPLEEAVALDHGDLVLVNDALRLYLLVNLPADIGEAGTDRVTVYVDGDGDGAPSPGIDRRYVAESGSPRLAVETLGADGSWSPVPVRTSSARAAGFGAFFADDSPDTEHRIWELGIDLAEIEREAGDAASVRILVESEDPAIEEWYPQGGAGSWQLTRVVLSGSWERVPIDPSVGGPSLGNRPLEVTQAVQTLDNDLPLVSKKTTVARAYVSGGFGFGGVLTVELHGRRGGADLPGSPLVQGFTSLPLTTREDLGHTSNFLLPDGWPEGTVEFEVVARDMLGRSAASGAIPISFTCKATPTYWIVPADLGSGAFASATTISSWQGFLETIFPVPAVDWVQQPSIGVVAEDDLIDELAEYQAGWLLVWILGLLATQQEPFPFPEQVIGVVTGAVNAGGRSDPVWSTNAIGVDLGSVAWISAGNTGREAGMSHEVNHNLDKDPTGTWGRHVSNPCDGFAGGTDGSWPYADDGIHEVGFDTRLPWSASGSVLTVLPADFPDIMSRCKAEDVGYPLFQLPSRWISPYRWENLFDTIRTLSPCLVPIPANPQIGPMVHLSGLLRADGTGRLRPAYRLPGLLGETGADGTYAVELVGAGGERIGGHRFSASFVDAEGVERETFPFRLQLPADRAGDVRVVRLVREDEVLDRIVVSPAAPALEVETPAPGGPTGKRLLRWTASDPDGDGLEFQVLWSPDGGSRWFPVGRRVRGGSLEIDTDRLPGSDRGLFRVIATDGFHTVQADTAAETSVGNKAPEAVARVARHDGRIEAGEIVRLVGAARDLEDGELSGDRLAWKIDGRVVGTGPTLRTRLRAGTWEIVLEATDGDGASGTATVTVTAVAPEPVFLRADSDGSGKRDISDAIAILGYLFLGSFDPPCLDALDVDDNGQVSLADAIRTLTYLFREPIGIPAPFASCGADPTADSLGCETSAACAR